ncbi:unnamed protein product [Brassicogethes aeneus]|uniref:Uncharacterized protein n=1 Tax=Brassicogethes aeneus TaxID=1431903 RepID=A0A9P0FDU4_BRAAE|nr:unnamed protein product [Brassicogethes aeneus]
MIPIYDHYQLVQKPSSKINPIWNMTNIFIFCVILILSFATCYTFGEFSRKIDKNCILHTRINLEPLHKDTVSNCSMMGVMDLSGKNLTENNVTEICRFYNSYPQIEQEQYSIHWGSEKNCHIFLNLTLLSMIAGAVFLVVTLVLKYQGANAFNESYTVFPMIFCCLALTCVQFYNTAALENGFNAYCEHFKNYTQTEKCTNSMNLYTPIIMHNKEKNYFLNYMLSTCFSNVTAWFWLTQFFIYLLRFICIADFTIKKVTVYQKAPHTEINMKKLLKNGVNSDHI